MPDPLKEAIEAGSLEVVKAAIEADPKAARHAKYMGSAAGAAFLPAVQLLHQNGGDLKRKDKEGSTPIDIAEDCKRGKLIAMMRAAV